MNTEDAGGSGSAINLAEEAKTVLAPGGDVTDLLHKIHQLGPFVCPPSCTRLAPNPRLFRSDNTHTDMAGRFSDWSLHASVQNAADFDWPVMAGTEQIQRGSP